MKNLKRGDLRRILNRSMIDSFLYCWTDHKTNKLYVGSHKGTPEDGYICSSKIMMEEYKIRPKDFTRQIIAEGKFQDIRKLEEVILEAVNAKLDEQFYNQSNGRADFYIKKHSLDAKRKMSQAWQNPNRTKPMFGRKHSAETIEKIRQRAIGRVAPNRGIPHSDEVKDKIRQKAIGRLHTEETKKKISETVKNIKSLNKDI